MYDFIKVKDFALSAAKEACARIMQVYDTGFESSIKKDGSPVTLADRLASKAISDVLLPYGIPLICEEKEIAPFAIRRHWKEYWLIDPLDGTKEFVRKSGEFCVNIAFVQNNAPLFGLIASPVSGEVLFGDEGNGLWLGNLHEDLENFQRIKKCIYLSDTWRVLGSKTYGCAATAEVSAILELKPNELLKKGSALKFMDLALNRADLYLRNGPTMEWDTAAGQAILEAVGGGIVDYNGESLRYNKESLLNPSFMAKTLTFMSENNAEYSKE